MYIDGRELGLRGQFGQRLGHEEREHESGGAGNIPGRCNPFNGDISASYDAFPKLAILRFTGGRSQRRGKARWSHRGRFRTHE